MAEARLLNIRTSRDERVAQLTHQSQLLFTYCIPILDNEGRMPGEPGAVRELAASLLPWNDDTVDRLIAEWERTTRARNELQPLVVRYPIDPPRRWRHRELQLEYECRLALEFQGFARNQPLRFRRGARSSLPPPGLNAGQMVIESLSSLDAHDSLEGPMGDKGDDRFSIHARARAPVRGSDGFAAAACSAESQEQEQLAANGSVARDPSDELAWLGEAFTATFAAASAPVDAERGARLSAAVERLGRSAVLLVLEEKAAKSLRPKSLAYFLPALEERAAAVRPAPTPRERRVCVECETGAGLHASDCSLAPPPDLAVLEQRRRLDEIGSSDAVRRLSA